MRRKDVHYKFDPNSVALLKRGAKLFGTTQTDLLEGWVINNLAAYICAEEKRRGVQQLEGNHEPAEQ